MDHLINILTKAFGKKKFKHYESALNLCNYFNTNSYTLYLQA